MGNIVSPNYNHRKPEESGDPITRTTTRNTEANQVPRGKDDAELMRVAGSEAGGWRLLGWLTDSRTSISPLLFDGGLLISR